MTPMNDSDTKGGFSISTCHEELLGAPLIVIQLCVIYPTGEVMKKAFSALFSVILYGQVTLSHLTSVFFLSLQLNLGETNVLWSSGRIKF